MRLKRHTALAGEVTASAALVRTPRSPVGQVVIAMISVGAMLATLLAAVTASPAAAELADDGENIWMTSGGDVRAITKAGGNIWVGGQFTGVKPNNSATPTSQKYLAAFNPSNGTWLSGITPTLNGAVRSLALTADGTKLIVGGEFSTINGQARGGLALLDATSGALLSLHANVTGKVLAIQVDGPHIYIGGDFSYVNGTRRYNMARLNAADMSLDPLWQPEAKGGDVFDLALSPSGDRMYAVGSFSNMNGDFSRKALAAVNVGNGGLDLGFVPSTNSMYVLSIEVVDENYVVTAQGSWPNVFRVWNANGSLLKSYTGNGDFQDALVVGKRAYAGGHFNGTFNGRYALNIAAINYDGTFGDSPSFDTEVGGTFAVWDQYFIDGKLYVGGDIIRIGTKNLSGFGRVGATATPPDPVRDLYATNITQTTLLLDWNVPNQKAFPIAGYRVMRNGEQIGWTTESRFTDTDLVPGTAYYYSVEALDTDHNGSESRTITVSTTADTAAPSSPANLTAPSVDESHATLAWNASTDNVGVFGYIIRRNGSERGRTTGLTFTEMIYTSWTTRTYDVFAYDEFGNESLAASITVNADGSEPSDDTEAPSTVLGAPAPNSTIDTDPVVFTGSASDNEGVGDVWIVVKNKETGQWLRTDGSFGSWQKLPTSLASAGSTFTTWSYAASLPESTFTVNVLTDDINGNSDPDSYWRNFSVNFSGDVTAPAATLGNPIQNATYSAGALTFSGTATDNLSVDEVYIVVKNKTTGQWLREDGTWGAWQRLSTTLTAGGTTSTNWSTARTLNVAGTFQVNVLTYDAAGNQDPGSYWTKFFIS